MLIKDYSYRKALIEIKHDCLQTALCVGSTIWFMSPAGASTFIAWSTVVCVVGCVTRLGFAYAVNRTPAIRHSVIWDLALVEATMLHALFKSAILGMTVATLFHEFGHASTAHLLTGIVPYIVLEPPPTGGGVTYYFFSLQSRLGKILGKHWSSIAITAAGPLATTLFCCLALEIANYLAHRECFETSLFFGFTAIASAINQIAYALSSFAMDNTVSKGHDFINLWNRGIHPLIMITVLTLPIVYSLAKKVNACIDRLVRVV